MMEVEKMQEMTQDSRREEAEKMRQKEKIGWGRSGENEEGGKG